MNQNLLNPYPLEYMPPWHLQGDAFILNYWLTPSFIQQSTHFRQTPSPIGRLIQVLLVRYQHSPVGPYDELLILDHPLISKRRLSSIPKIFVSTEISVQHGQQLWGIPKELATFEWQEQGQDTHCTIYFAQQCMHIHLRKPKKQCSFYINSHYLPAAVVFTTISGSLIEIGICAMGKYAGYFSQFFRGKICTELLCPSL